jgi:alkylation response protein AidB-like acyl-CoA dehydrogenase
MDFRDSPAEAGFRAAFRAWLDVNTPREPAPLHGPARASFWARWHHALYQGGWMGLSWPVEYGGRGLPAIYEAIFNEEIGAAGAPPAPHVGFLGRALLHFGTDEQRSALLPGLLSGQDAWCQGFSEPGAGSDLSALSTRATPHPLDGDPAGGYLVNGQKVWTSDAAWADRCLLLVRTDPAAPRHRGISALVVDMRAPGVEVRPIVQINGDTEFNEVFFTDVVVPAAALVGRPGQGWEIAMTTVGYERGPTDVGFSSRYARLLAELEAGARAAAEAGTVLDPSLLADLARARVLVSVLRAHVLRSLSARTDGVPPGPEGSIDKLLATRTEQALHHVAMDLAGAGVLVGSAPAVLADYLYSRGSSIAGGTRQIQLGIVAERVLGLPRAR